ncbi:MAG TPA: isoprenyl transferase [Acidobacteriota bacterium]|nr:isoprenyl transferase [Acidobacteriota bacterium]
MKDLGKNFEGVWSRNGAEMRLLEQIDPERLPNHVAVIMDGNGRWAGMRMLPRVAGHKAGIEAVRATVEHTARLEIPALTLYAFSTENWKRPENEIDTLMNLLKDYLQRELGTLQKHRIRFRPIGQIDDLPVGVAKELRHAERATRDNQGMQLTVALSYSGRQELVGVVNRMLEEGLQPPIGENDIRSRLYTAELPDPDLLIRTSGEMRVSNFLLWQIAYSEIYVTDVLWPDFRGLHLLEAILDYQKRDRRFGGVRVAPLQHTG